MLIRKKLISDIGSVEFAAKEVPKDHTKPVDKKTTHYVNNRDLYDEFVKYNEKKKYNLENGLAIPPLTNKIGKAILQIAKGRCNCRLYVGYTNAWKEELIGNAIEVMTKRCHGFDPAKSTNPFAYLTSIADNAIKEQIKREKKQLYIRYKSVENSGYFNATEDENGNDVDFVRVFVEEKDTRATFINDYEEKNCRSVRGSKPIRRRRQKESDEDTIKLF